MTRVLIVDDKPVNLNLLRMLLQGHGCTVDEARIWADHVHESGGKKHLWTRAGANDRPPLQRFQHTRAKNNEKFTQDFPAAGETIREYENEVLHKDGTRILMSTNAVFIRDAGGNIVGCPGTEAGNDG